MSPFRPRPYLGFRGLLGVSNSMNDDRSDDFWSVRILIRADQDMCLEVAMDSIIEALKGVNGCKDTSSLVSPVVGRRARRRALKEFDYEGWRA